MHLSRIAALCTTVLLVACADEARDTPAPAAPKAAAPPPAQKQVATVKPEPAARSKAKPCDDVTPHFAFDGTEPLLSGPDDLRELAQCLGKGLEDGETITLVGRTDARGSEAYNLALGRRRAERVRWLLAEYGLPADLIEVQSAGERSADGNSTWKARRVDIVRSDQRMTRQ
jgi:outer membrane protein OmpA-like peptidoglycan-associated protein